MCMEEGPGGAQALRPGHRLGSGFLVAVQIGEWTVSHRERRWFGAKGKRRKRGTSYVLERLSTLRKACGADAQRTWGLSRWHRAELGCS